MLREEPDQRKGEMSSCNTFMGVTYSFISLNTKGRLFKQSLP